MSQIHIRSTPDINNEALPSPDNIMFKSTLRNTPWVQEPKITIQNPVLQDHVKSRQQRMQMKKHSTISNNNYIENYKNMNNRSHSREEGSITPKRMTVLRKKFDSPGVLVNELQQMDSQIKY